MSLAECPRPPTVSFADETLRNPLLDEEESKQKTLPDPKKQSKMNAKKASGHRDDAAFQTYIFRVCKEVCPETGISKKAMSTMNHIIADKFEEIMSESRGLIVNTKKGTITSKEVETACRLLIKGDLGSHSV